MKWIACVAALALVGAVLSEEAKPAKTLPKSALFIDFMNDICSKISESNKGAVDRKSSLDAINGKAATRESLAKKITIARGTIQGTPSIMCVTFSLEDPARGETLHELWGKQCDYHLMLTSKAGFGQAPTSGKMTTVDMPKAAWKRQIWLWKYIVDKGFANQYKYFFISGDNMLLFPENLRKMLLEPAFHEMNEFGTPLVMGHYQVSDRGTEFVSGTAYLLNTVAVKVLPVIASFDDCSPTKDIEHSDTQLGVCMATVGIRPRGTSDEFGEDRIIIVDPVRLAIEGSGYVPWYKDMRRDRTMPTGNGVLSRHVVAVRFIDLAQAKSFDELVRKGQ